MSDASSLINEKNPLVENISKIIKLVLANEWNFAKTICILDVIKLKPQRRRFSTFGDEHEFFISFVNELQLVNFYCESCESIFYSKSEMYFDLDENMNVRLSLDEKRVCSFCGGEKLANYFDKKPNWLFIQCLYSIKNNNL